MRRLSTFIIGAVVGAALAYLLDPDRGRSRRARLADQAAARSRDIAESAKQSFEYQKGVARGVAHEISEQFGPERTYDDETLRQKVRSEVLGHLDGSHHVEVDITNGMVVVTGSVDDQESHDRVLHLIGQVDGVTLIDDRIEFGAV
jgi:osmotically-inducible protein OsmY